MATERNDHLTADGIQAFLEGELPKSEVRTLREHLASCARCQAEVEAFRFVFAELGTLPELAPSEYFAERVMGELPSRLGRALVPEPAPVRGRIGEWLRARIPRRAPGGDHPPGEWLQDYVEGIVPRRRRAGIQAHLAACTACHAEVAEWGRLFSSMEALPALAPSEGFAERVMAEVRMPEASALPAPADPLRARALELARRMRPTGPRGWALAGGIAMAPGVAFAAVGYMILSHPLLTFGYLAAFLWWQVTGALSALAGGIMSQVVESATAFRAYGAIEALVTSPAMAAFSALSLGALMVAALWILYRNLILPPMVAGHDAR